MWIWALPQELGDEVFPVGIRLVGSVWDGSSLVW